MSQAGGFYVGLPNNGRLSGITEYCLVQMGISLEGRRPKQLYLNDRDTGVRFRWLRGEDIPMWLRDNAIQLGVVGNDYVAEDSPNLVALSPLGWCAGHLCLITHVDSSVNCLGDLKTGSTIYAQYPKTARRLLKQSHATGVRVVSIRGAAESLFQMDMLRYKCDAIVDVVATGESLADNGLRIVGKLAKTCAWLYSNSKAYMNIDLTRFALAFIDAAQNVSEDTIGDIQRANADARITSPRAGISQCDSIGLADRTQKLAS